ncbi:extensin [Streptomyces sp. NPDC002851]
MKHPDAHEAVALLRFMTRVLCTVGVLALVFTTVNVTQFATSRGVPLAIAVLLDPMLGIALAGVLYVDARLASWGIRPPAWSTTLRWSAGCTAALMNTWESLWPDGQIGWPHRADPAAVLLHLTPALLLIALTETIAAYRRTITHLMHQIDTTDPAEDHPNSTPTEAGSTGPASGPADTPPIEDGEALTAADRGPGGSTAAPPAPSPTPGHTGPVSADSPPTAPPPPPGGQPAQATSADGDVWDRAVALDRAVRRTTGRPASIWRLRTELRIGPARARQIHHQLATRPATPPADSP